MRDHFFIATVLASALTPACADVMTGPFAATTVLNAPACGLVGPAPGTRTAMCVVDAAPPSAAACSAACLAAAECTAFTWHAPGNGVWSLACVFRTDGAWQPTMDAPAHFAGRKVAPPAWPVADGFARLPTMWFGANASGLDAPETLALIARHRVAVYGWQQGTASSSSGGGGGGGPVLGSGDALQAAAATHLADFLDSLPAQRGANRTLVGVYRQVMIAQQLFAGAHAAASNASDDGFWLRSGGNASSAGDGVDGDGVVCRFGMPWGTADPVFNFSVKEAADYWVDTIVGAVAAEAVTAGVRVVFLDDSDYNFCGFWTKPEGNCAALPAAALAAMHMANNEVLGRTAAALNAAGIIPLFSSVNVLAAASTGLPGPPAVACALPEDATLAALAGTTFARFYEFFPALEQGGADVAATAMANAILEGAAGVPFVAHFFAPSCPAAPRNITRPGRLGGPIELQLALFLAIQTQAAIFSISNDWFDKDYCWHSEFDVSYGAPLAPAVRTGPYAWARNFSAASVMVDVQAMAGEVTLL